MHRIVYCAIVLLATSAHAQETSLTSGSWEARFKGYRKTITHDEDGTANLEVVFSRLAALRYGKRVQLNLEWERDGKNVSYEILGGTPEDKAARIVNDFGAHMEFRILNETDSEIVLQDPNDSEERIVWKPVPKNQ